MKKEVFLLLSCIGINLIVAETFVVAKKKPRISGTKLKESIGQNLGEVLQKSADMITYQAQAQKECIKKTKQLVDQDPESFFAKATTQKLQECDTAVANLLEVMDDCQKKIQHAFTSVCRCTQ